MNIKREALYYEKLNNNRVKCHLCPHGCNIRDGNIGTCRVRENEGGKLYTINYGQITSYAYDPIEKKPLYHFYPGSVIFSAGSFGCNLKCAFCQNWQIAHDKPFTLEVTPSKLVQLAKKNNSIGIAYTYNEPSIWYEFVLDAAKEAKKEGIKNVLVTNGYIEDGPLRELLPYIDAMNIDVKGFNNDYYNKICGGRLEPVLQTVQTVSKETLVEITTLIIKGHNDDLGELEKLFQWINSIDRSIPLHLSRYFPMYKMANPPTDINIIINAKNIARKYLDYVYIGNVWGVDNNTYCPECNNKLVDREIEIRVVGIEDNRCNKCGYEINIKNR